MCCAIVRGPLLRCARGGHRSHWRGKESPHSDASRERATQQTVRELAATGGDEVRCDARRHALKMVRPNQARAGQTIWSEHHRPTCPGKQRATLIYGNASLLVWWRPINRARPLRAVVIDVACFSGGKIGPKVLQTIATIGSLRGASAMVLPNPALVHVCSGQCGVGMVQHLSTHKGAVLFDCGGFWRISYIGKNRRRAKHDVPWSPALRAERTAGGADGGRSDRVGLLCSNSVWFEVNN